MTSSTTYKILAPLAAAAVALGGLAMIDRLPEPASAVTQALYTSSETPTESSDPSDDPARSPQAAATRVDGVAHQTGALTEAQNTRVLDYWTSERMASAQPITSLLDSTLDLASPGGATETEPQASRPDSDGERWNDGGLVTRTTGKVYLTMDGRDFTCSASVVDSANKSTLVTAGHCAKDGRGSWARNWTFVPGYADGESPYGKYTARDLMVPPRWADKADDSYDFAMVVLNKNGSTAVQDEVGAQRISFDTWTDERARQGVQVYTFGYPSASPFDGSSLHYCSGRTVPDTGGTTANGVRCTMTQGSSGGPWFSDFDPATGQGTISSVVSFKYADDRNTQYGPRLGAEARQLFEHASGV
ncbi:trypsin-like serine protease [Nocardiopsis alba]|jgi:V8-like Glu-specific endopeptidase|uniref:trypsin-like serine peptidase n=1 Tax=Nocardiopsis TaxID=2013 RepID=UPI002DB6C01F|nr:trypsin-like serine protease [Nocardiopsis sp. LDBS1602]MEC3895855.1 trypsin-like serine protease [Nocardiopsis sp. LDBS1602]